MQILSEELQKDLDYIRSNVINVYKYINIDGAINILSDHMLLFKNPSQFNDPYDCYQGLINFTATENYKKYLLQEIEFWPESHKNQIIKELSTYSDEDIISFYTNILIPTEFSSLGITCFSENYNNLLMWSHYTNSHQGICIGFNLEQLYKNLLDKMPALFRVHYTNNFEKKEYLIGKEDAFTYCFTRKSDLWIYEEEIRIVLFQIFFDVNNHHFESFGQEAISEIFLGSKIDAVDKERIILICEQNFSKAKVYQMKLDKESFNLIPDQIR